MSLVEVPALEAREATFLRGRGDSMFPQSPLEELSQPLQTPQRIPRALEPDREERRSPQGFRYEERISEYLEYLDPCENETVETMEGQSESVTGFDPLPLVDVPADAPHEPPIPRMQTPVIQRIFQVQGQLQRMKRLMVIAVLAAILCVALLQYSEKPGEALLKEIRGFQGVKLSLENLASTLASGTDTEDVVPVPRRLSYTGCGDTGRDRDRVRFIVCSFTVNITAALLFLQLVETVLAGAMEEVDVTVEFQFRMLEIPENVEPLIGAGVFPLVHVIFGILDFCVFYLILVLRERRRMQVVRRQGNPYIHAEWTQLRDEPRVDGNELRPSRGHVGIHGDHSSRRVILREILTRRRADEIDGGRRLYDLRQNVQHRQYSQEEPIRSLREEDRRTTFLSRPGSSRFVTPSVIWCGHSPSKCRGLRARQPSLEPGRIAGPSVVHLLRSLSEVLLLTIS